MYKAKSAGQSSIPTKIGAPGKPTMEKPRVSSGGGKVSTPGAGIPGVK